MRLPLTQYQNARICGKKGKGIEEKEVEEEKGKMNRVKRQKDGSPRLEDEEAAKKYDEEIVRLSKGERWHEHAVIEQDVRRNSRRRNRSLRDRERLEEKSGSYDALKGMLSKGGHWTERVIIEQDGRYKEVWFEFKVLK